MLEMIRARKEQLKAEGKKGFTLMEMLIVIAIIAILIAIAIPVFTEQMHKAELATDVSNVRSAYSEAVSTAMVDAAGKDTTDTTYYTTDGKLKVSMTDPCKHGKATVSTTSPQTVTVTHSATFDGNSQTFDIDKDVQLTISSGSSGGTGGGTGGNGGN